MSRAGVSADRDSTAVATPEATGVPFPQFGCLRRLIAAIPAHEAWGLDGALPFVIGGLAVAAIALFVATLIRPGRGEMMQLFDLYDQALGRR